MKGILLVIVMACSQHLFAQLTIFGESGQSGTSATCSVSTIYTGASIPGNLNDAVSSIQLQQGNMATLAENEDGSGSAYTFIAAVSDVAVDLNPMLNNKVSFIRVLPFRNTLKKGVGNQDNTIIDKLNVSWFYDWGALDISLPGREYAMMAWGKSAANDPSKIASYISKTDVTQLLSFNEPDNTSQSNISATDAIPLHENLAQTGLRIGSPATTEGQVLVWQKDFEAGTRVANNKVDFVAIHWYDWGNWTSTNNPAPDPNGVFTRFKNYVNSVYAMYGKPIWITEFNANINTTSATHEAFINLALPWLESQAFVERYAYFFPSTLPPVDINGNMTAIGNVYKNFSASTPAIARNYDNTELLTEKLNTKLEAETYATLYGPSITSCATASGGSMVGAVTGANKTVFHNIVVFNAGTYNFDMSYFNLAAKTINVRVNYGSIVSSTIPASGTLWCYQGGSPGVATLSVNLLEGKNSIEFTETPILDYIKLASNGALPSTLMSLNGVARQKTIDLNWRTAQEENTRYFDVQKSSDGNQFVSIGKVKAAGNSTSPSNYLFTDNNPTQGINFYKLKTVDMDGSFTYSNNVAVKFDARNSGLSLVSSGAQKIKVLAYSDVNEKASIVMYGIDGRMLYKNDVFLNQGPNYFDIPASTLEGTLGVVSLYTGKNINTLKIIR